MKSQIGITSLALLLASCIWDSSESKGTAPKIMSLSQDRTWFKQYESGVLVAPVLLTLKVEDPDKDIVKLLLEEGSKVQEFTNPYTMTLDTATVKINLGVPINVVDTLNFKLSLQDAKGNKSEAKSFSVAVVPK